MKGKELITTPLIDKNPVTLQVLGICSALAITNAVMTALIMAISATAVLAFSNVSISLIRNYIPNSVRIIIEMTIIATGVIVVDQVLKAFLPDVARTLSVFVGEEGEPSETEDESADKEEDAATDDESEPDGDGGN